LITGSARQDREIGADHAGSPSEARCPTVVVAHDYLTQRGGAERVARELAAALHAERFVTSAYDPKRTFDDFAHIEVQCSFLGKVPFLRSDPRRALPILPLIWRLMPPVEAEVVVCSSSGWAHAIRTRPGVKKVVYCHNPARWLYQREEFLLDQNRLVRAVLTILTPMLKGWARQAARSADLYIANSRSVARRIWEAYGIRAEVVHPPVLLGSNGAQKEMTGLLPGYFVTVGRGRGYKNSAAVIDAFRSLPTERLVVVGQVADPTDPPNVKRVGEVSEQELRWLYANARALISVSFEDFGLTPLEANSLGTPALLLRAGGFLDSTDEGVSAVFVDSPAPEAIAQAVTSFPTEWDKAAIRKHALKFPREAFATKMWEVVERSMLDSLCTQASKRGRRGNGRAS
jgi:glycosyltransferase involved in cell wall biosynthesis